METLIDPFIFRLSIFVLAIFVGYYVVWSVTPALHTPLMSVTNAISSVIVVGALIAVGVTTTPRTDPPVHTTVLGQSYVGETPPRDSKSFSLVPIKVLSQPDEMRAAWTSKLLGFFALVLASVNIFGGFLGTQRMLAMYRKKEKK